MPMALRPAGASTSPVEGGLVLGDMCWATLKGFPPWPAVISCSPKTCAWKRGAQYVQVTFFGDYTHRSMREEDLELFSREPTSLQRFMNVGAKGRHDRLRATAIEAALGFFGC